MKSLKKIAVNILIFCLSASFLCEAEYFNVPSSLKAIESEAFFDIAADSVVIPSGIEYVADDAFPTNVTSVYGNRGSEAERFALDTNRDFISIDIDNLSADTVYASPNREFTVFVSCDSLFPVRKYKLSAMQCGAEVCTYESDTPVFSFSLSEPGTYDMILSASDDWTESTAAITGGIVVYEPVCIASDVFTMAPGDVLTPVCDEESRNTVLTCADDGIFINGKTITALSGGTYTVTAEADCGTGICYTDFTVNVIEPVIAIDLSVTSLALPVGSEFKTECALTPEIDGRKVTWSTDDPSVASVSADGIITAAAPGVCLITASTFRAEATIPVTVFTPAESISINTVTETYLTGTKLRFSSSVLPVQASANPVIWNTSDDAVIKIDADGTASFVSPGTAVISVISMYEPDIRDELEITVLQGAELVDLDVPAKLTVGENTIAEAVCQPEGSDNRIVWSSSNPDILSVDSEGCITALSSGKSIVTASALNGCSASAQITVYAKPESLSIITPAVYINSGKNINLRDLVSVSPANIDESILHFSSSNTDIAAVDDKGNVTAVSGGTCIITVTVCDLAAQIAVSVITDSNAAYAAAISPSYAITTVGSEVILKPVWPKDVSASYARGIWYIEDSSIVRVTDINSAFAVKILGLSEGTTDAVFVTSGGTVISCPITVNPLVADSISLSESALTLESGDTYSLTCSFSPIGARETIAWSSYDEAVATVDSFGNVTALKAGSTVITAATASGKTACCNVTVPVITMESAEAQALISGKAGDCFTVEYSFEPQNASPAAFSWWSENEEIAVIDELSGAGRFMAKGETVLHGYALDESGIVLDIAVTVEEIPVTGMIVSTVPINLSTRETTAIACTVLPADASWGTPVFTSSDESVVTVSQDGIITAIGKGSAVITVSAGRGEYAVSDTIEVNVTSDNDTVYRALIMGQFTVPGSAGYLPFSTNGTRGVYDAFSLSRIENKSYNIRFMPSSPSASSFRDAIRKLASEADEDDVTVIYVIAHGHYNEKNGIYDFTTSSGEYVYGDALINEVTRISGHVVLCLCTCHSGRILSSTSVNRLKASNGIYEGSHGEGRLSILTSATDTISSYYNIPNASLSYDFYSKAYTEGLGWDMIADRSIGIAADSNGDRAVTVNELAAFTRTRTQYLISTFIQINGTSQYHGHTSQYPSKFIAEGEGNLTILAR